METVNQETNVTVDKAQSEPASDKTFTQAELNEIVQSRIERERAKYEGYEALKEKAAKFDELEEASKSELQKAQEKVSKLEAEINKMKHEKEISEIKAKVSKEKGIPIDLLTGETEEACISQADNILSFARANGYPSIVDGGEPQGIPKVSVEDQFKLWAQQNL